MNSLHRLSGRPFCWVLGHRVGPAQTRPDHNRDNFRLVRISRCTRCGRAFAGETQDQSISIDR